jgi:uncharacterized membrane protein/ribosomal protein L40E
MASLSSAKTLGGIGGILVFLPGLSLVGWILILISLNEISDVVHDRSIFDDALIAGITGILGAVALLVFLVSGAFSTLITFGALTFGTAGVLAAVGTLAFFWVFAIVSAIFLKRAYEKTSQRLNVHAFATAGVLYLIGAVTAIILVGFIILFIALIFQVIAYFSIQDQPVGFVGAQPPSSSYTAQPMQQPASAPQAAQEFKFCHKCGAKISSSAEFCPSCGTKQ